MEGKLEKRLDDIADLHHRLKYTENQIKYLKENGIDVNEYALNHICDEIAKYLTQNINNLPIEFHNHTYNNETYFNIDYYIISREKLFDLLKLEDIKEFRTMASD